MTWIYQAIRHNEKGKYDRAWIGLHEVFYDDQGRIQGFDATPIVNGDNIEEIVTILDQMKADLEKYPVLSEDVETVGFGNQ